MASKNSDLGKSLIPRSFSRFSSFLPSFFDDMKDDMSRWMGLTPPSDITVSEDNKNVYVEAHTPGLDTADLDISIHQNTLWIRGEKREEQQDKDKTFYRRARRSFFYQVDLPAQVEENTEKAEYQNGVLRITFRKMSSGNVKKINISRGAASSTGTQTRTANTASQSGKAATSNTGIQTRSNTESQSSKATMSSNDNQPTKSKSKTKKKK